MAGRIKQTIEVIVSQRAKGNALVAQAMKAKFVLKGINPDSYTTTSPDDPAVMKKLEALAQEMGIRI